jgi:hypothetical protein
MANTTNYNWETPDDTDLVKDGAAAIRTLGNSVDTTTKALNPETTLGDIAYRSATSNTNTRLAIGSAGQVLTVASGVPSWASPSDQTPLTTKGDVFTFSTVDARLGVGANGTVLTADSAETTGLKWAAPAGGGKVLQVVSATYSTQATNSTNTFADTGLTVTITPTLVTSKILVLMSQNGSGKHSGNANSGCQLKLLRGATTIATLGSREGWTNTDSYNIIGSISTAYLDSPATTSATTYKTQFANYTNAALAIVQQDGVTSTITLLEIGA